MLICFQTDFRSVMCRLKRAQKTTLLQTLFAHCKSAKLCLQSLNPVHRWRSKISFCRCIFSFASKSSVLLLKVCFIFKDLRHFTPHFVIHRSENHFALFRNVLALKKQNVYESMTLTFVFYCFQLLFFICNKQLIYFGF